MVNSIYALQHLLCHRMVSFCPPNPDDTEKTRGKKSKALLLNRMHLGGETQLVNGGMIIGQPAFGESQDGSLLVVLPDRCQGSRVRETYTRSVLSSPSLAVSLSSRSSFGL